MENSYNKFPPNYGLVKCPTKVIKIINNCWKKLYHESKPLDRYRYLYYPIEHCGEESYLILESLRKNVEDWCGRKLICNKIYGIKDFYMNTIVPSHGFDADIGVKILIKSDVEWGIDVKHIMSGEENVIRLNKGGMLVFNGRETKLANFEPFSGMYYREVELSYNFK